VIDLDASSLGLPSADGVRVAARSELGGLSRVLGRAFHDDPVYRWIFPDPEERARKSPRMFSLFLRQVTRHGIVLTDDGLRGVALWRPPQIRMGRFEELGFNFAMFRLLGARSLEIGRGFAPVEALHPREPHAYLPLLGTDPAHHGQGVGSTLLGPVLRACDRLGVLAYLESSKESNIAFYQRHGFEVVEPFTIRDGPTVWPMQRPARG
jgi:ribosomal protein S18 acetylase RimI-like enzyme